MLVNTLESGLCRTKVLRLMNLLHATKLKQQQIVAFLKAIQSYKIFHHH